MALDQERKQALDEVLEKIEAIGFFAAIGMHFAESTPLLSEDLGGYVKGAPWERFSSTDQCLKMIHKLAKEVWNSLERVSACVEPQIGPEEIPNHRRRAAISQDHGRIHHGHGL